MDEDLDGRMHECMKGSIDWWLKGIAELSYGWNLYNNAQVDIRVVQRKMSFFNTAYFFPPETDFEYIP